MAKPARDRPAPLTTQLGAMPLFTGLAPDDIADVAD
jgi:hypothetical protein